MSLMDVKKLANEKSMLNLAKTLHGHVAKLIPAPRPNTLLNGLQPASGGCSHVHSGNLNSTASRNRVHIKIIKTAT